MTPREHLSDAALIEFHLHDSDHEALIRQHLMICAECAKISDSIAETLRVFSGDPIPESNLDHKWQRLRGTLPAVVSSQQQRFRLSRWSWSLAASAFVTMVLILFATLKPSHFEARRENTAVMNRPFSANPTESQIAEQLDSAERLLTVVNHTSGTLDDLTREQAHNLLLKNAVYIRTAREQGDFGTAAVLDDFGRILTNICYEPKSPNNGSNLRREWNTSGLLFDVRILQQSNGGRAPLENKED